MFEFDPVKSEFNKQKHGVDFVAAQKLWEDQYRVVVPARTTDEVRYLMIAGMDERLWSAIYTVRNEKIRIISVRRSRTNEQEIYYSQKL